MYEIKREKYTHHSNLRGISHVGLVKNDWTSIPFPTRAATECATRWKKRCRAQWKAVETTTLSPPLLSQASSFNFFKTAKNGVVKYRTSQVDSQATTTTKPGYFTCKAREDEREASGTWPPISVTPVTTSGGQFFAYSHLEVSRHYRVIGFIIESGE